LIRFTGQLFLVLSVEHPLTAELIDSHPEKEKLQAWIKKTYAETRARREIKEEEKVGYDTGLQAINPFTGQPIPIFLANYILMDYGTGAVMGVPAHDQRDYEFAAKYNLPIVPVIKPASSETQLEAGRAFEEYGILINSGEFSGLSSAEAMEKMAALAEAKRLWP